MREKRGDSYILNQEKKKKEDLSREKIREGIREQRERFRFQTKFRERNQREAREKEEEFGRRRKSGFQGRTAANSDRGMKLRV